jgi:hypothetical protein
MTIRTPLFVLLAVLAAACSSSSTNSAAKPADGGTSKKPQSLDGGTPAGTGKKGGDGNKTPSATSGSAGSATTSASGKTPVQSDGGENPCAGVADGRAACGDATTLFFCAGQQLYALDCDAFGRANDFGGGACYQAGEVTDCFGCSGNVCCAQTSASSALCCDDTSACAVITE